MHVVFVECALVYITPHNAFSLQHYVELLPVADSKYKLRSETRPMWNRHKQNIYANVFDTNMLMWTQTKRIVYFRPYCFTTEAGEVPSFSATRLQYTTVSSFRACRRCVVVVSLLCCCVTGGTCGPPHLQTRQSSIADLPPGAQFSDVTWWGTVNNSLRRRLYKPVCVFGPLYENMTSSTKPEVHNALHCGYRTTKSRRATDNMYRKFREVWTYTFWYIRADRQTYRHTHADRNTLQHRRCKKHFLWSPYVIGRPYIFSSCDFYLSFFFLFFLA